MTDWAASMHLYFAVEILGSLLLAALGVFAMTRKPRASGHVWFGVFTLGFGARSLVSSASVYLHAGMDVYWTLNVAPAITLGIAGAILPLVFPARLRPHERKLLFPAAALAILLVALQAYTLMDRSFARETRRVFEYADLLTGAAWMGALMLFALRFRGEPDVGARRKLALAATAFTLPLAFGTGYVFVWRAHAALDLTQTPGRTHLAALAGLVGFVLIAALWLGAREDRRIARRLAWLPLALGLAGALVAAARQEPYLGLNVLKMVMALTLAYAILKHQLLGDVQLRYAISRSTIAAVFIAAFFVASEAAQQYFGDTLGSAYVGILAAGALVFAIAPLSRLADRLAEKAVPPAAAPPATSAEEAYRAAVRLALRGGITRTEEIDLARIADAHGLGAVRALELRAAVEEETHRAPEAPR